MAKHTIQPNISPVMHVLIQSTLRRAAATTMIHFGIISNTTVRWKDVGHFYWVFTCHAVVLVFIILHFTQLGKCLCHVFWDYAVEACTRIIYNLTTNVHLALYIFFAEAELAKHGTLRLIMTPCSLRKCRYFIRVIFHISLMLPVSATFRAGGF